MIYFITCTKWFFQLQYSVKLFILNAMKFYIYFYVRLYRHKFWIFIKYCFLIWFITNVSDNGILADLFVILSIGIKLHSLYLHSIWTCKIIFSIFIVSYKFHSVYIWIRVSVSKTFRAETRHGITRFSTSMYRRNTI